jgi:hypothetical protein
VGNPIDVKVVLGSIEIERAQGVPGLFSQLAQINGFNLLVVDGIPETAQVGAEMTVRWLWQKVENVESDVQAQLVWLNEDGNVVSVTPLVALTLDYPTSTWQVDDAWYGVHRLYVPGSLESGAYQVAIQSGNESTVVVATMQVETPERSYAIPDAEHETDTSWNNGIQLLGYDDTVTAVTVYWQTTTQIDQTLRLFAQVVDANDAIVALTDEIPVNWTRPTTSWAIGEVITTHHDFGVLPAGEYRIRIGWYDPITGNRIPVSTGEDSTFLPAPYVVD